MKAVPEAHGFDIQYYFFGPNLELFAALYIELKATNFSQLLRPGFRNAESIRNGRRYHSSSARRGLQSPPQGVWGRVVCRVRWSCSDLRGNILRT